MMAGIHRERGEILPGQGVSFEVDASPAEQSFVSECNVSFSNYNLGNLVNGWPDDPIENRPFDFYFSQDSIIKSHIAVGFMPMTC